MLHRRLSTATASLLRARAINAAARSLSAPVLRDSCLRVTNHSYSPLSSSTSRHFASKAGSSNDSTDSTDSPPSTSSSSSLIPSRTRSIVPNFVPLGHAPRMSELLVIPIRHPFFPGLTFDLPLSSLPPSVRVGLQSMTFKRLPYAGLFLHRKDQRVEERSAVSEKQVAAAAARGEKVGKSDDEESEEEKAEMAELSGVEDVHGMGVLVQFVVMGDRVKGNVHSRVRIKSAVQEKVKEGSEAEEREKRPLYAHVEHIEEHEQKKKTRDSSVNANADDAIAQQPPASTATPPSSSSSSSSSPSSAEPALRIGNLNDTDFNAYIKESTLR